MIGTLPQLLLESLDRRKAVHAGQPHVEDHHVGPLPLDFVKGLLGARRGDHLVPEALAQSRQSPADRLFVIDNQQFRHNVPPQTRWEVRS